MKITRISSHEGYGSKIVMACIVSSLERQARVVLNASGDSTTASILQMCSKPVPFAIVLNDFDPQLVDLEQLCSEPHLQNVLCFVEMTPAAEAEADDALSVYVDVTHAPLLISASDGILSLAADSEGGEPD